MSVADLANAIAILVALAFPAAITWLYFVALAGRRPILQRLAYGIGKSLQFALPIVWVALVQQTPIRPFWPTSVGLPTGLAFGLAVLTAMLAGYHLLLKPAGHLASAADAIGAKIAQFHITTPLRYLAMGIFYCLFHSLLEEYYWRWFVFGQLEQLLPVAVAVLVSALGFTLHHVIVLGIYFGGRSPATIVFSLAVAVGGAFWAWLYFQSGSLYGPWLSHLLIDAAIFLVGYDLVRARLR